MSASGGNQALNARASALARWQSSGAPSTWQSTADATIIGAWTYGIGVEEVSVRR